MDRNKVWNILETIITFFFSIVQHEWNFHVLVFILLSNVSTAYTLHKFPSFLGQLYEIT